MFSLFGRELLNRGKDPAGNGNARRWSVVSHAPGQFALLLFTECVVEHVSAQGCDAGEQAKKANHTTQWLHHFTST